MKRLIFILALIVAYGVSVSNTSAKDVKVEKSKVTVVADSNANPTTPVDKEKKVKKAAKTETKACVSEKEGCAGCPNAGAGCAEAHKKSGTEVQKSGSETVKSCCEGEKKKEIKE
jgi:hypothetical protein